MITVIDDLIIEVEEPCRNFIYLAWENLSGAFDFLGFGINQQTTLDTEADQEFQLEIADLSTSEGVLSYVQKTGREVISLSSENLTQDQIRYYRNIAISPNVYRLNNSSSPYEWLKVLVEQGSVGGYQTDGNNFNLQIEIRMPELFTLSN